jgi:hypothetical protein
MGCGVGVAQGVAAKFNKTSIWSSDRPFRILDLSIRTRPRSSPARARTTWSAN